MRRIMIARRNNLKDHATLKKARALVVDKISSSTSTSSSSGAVRKKLIQFRFSTIELGPIGLLGRRTIEWEQKRTSGQFIVTRPQ